MYAKIFMLTSTYLIFLGTRKSPFYNDENKKVIGKMKDELKGEIIGGFVGLRVKMYLLKKWRNEEDKRIEEEHSQKIH